jgi:hypothetical protein
MAATTTTTGAAAPAAGVSAVWVRLRVMVATWLCAALVAAGIAWAGGLETAWWQRLLLAASVGALIALDARGVDAVIDARVALAHLLAALGWMQAPLAVAGGAWLTGLTAGAPTRIALAGLVVAVAGLFRICPSAPAPAGGGR